MRAHCNASKNVIKTSRNKELVLHVEILYEGLKMRVKVQLNTEAATGGVL